MTLVCIYILLLRLEIIAQIYFYTNSLGKHSAQWALDDVLIGMNDSSRTGFHDKFDGTTPLRHNWYRIQGGEVTVDCLSLDTALTFNSEAIDSESHKHIQCSYVRLSVPHMYIHRNRSDHSVVRFSCCVHGKYSIK